MDSRETIYTKNDENKILDALFDTKCNFANSEQGERKISKRNMPSK